MNSKKSINLKNKTIVLTGAAGGIGKTICKVLAANGATLVLVGRSLLKLHALKTVLRNADQHHLLDGDLSQSRTIDELSEFCKALPNGIDMLINNAGIMDFGLSQHSDAERVEQVLMTNLAAPINLSNALLPMLIKKENAFLINIGSTFGSIAYPGFSTYCASKFGLRGFTESLRRELADTSLKVVYIAPRATKTAFNSYQIDAMNNKLGNHVDDPEVVAYAVLAAIAKNSSAVTYLGWPEKLFVRVNALLPSIVDSAIISKLPLIKSFIRT